MQKDSTWLQPQRSKLEKEEGNDAWDKECLLLSCERQERGHTLSNLSATGKGKKNRIYRALKI